MAPLPVVQPVCNTLLSEIAELIRSTSNVLYIHNLVFIVSVSEFFNFLDLYT